MNKQPHPINSDFLPQAIELAQEFDKTARNAWLSDYRQSQLDILKQSQFPHSKVEHFKYNRLHGFDGKSFNKLLNNATADTPNIEPIFAENAVKITFIDGQLNQKLSDFQDHQITSFDDVNADQQQVIITSLASQDVSKNPFILCNASVSNDGVLIEINEKSPKSLIEITSIITDTAKHHHIANQIIVDIAEKCRAKVVSRTICADNTTDTFSTCRIIANIADHAHLTHYHLSFENSDSLHFASIFYNLQAHCQLDTFHAMTGGILKKLDIEADHNGEHSIANIHGLYVASQHQQVDCHTAVNHVVAHGKTNENFRGLVNDHAEGVFNGRIHIYPDAQKTLAEMSNKNLVLSDNAVIHTKPELEIYADDVICAHGATVSQLQKPALNYLLARGIGRVEAKMMLSYAFFDELLADIEDQEVIDYVRPVLFKSFEG